MFSDVYITMFVSSKKNFSKITTYILLCRHYTICEYTRLKNTITSYVDITQTRDWKNTNYVDIIQHTHTQD